MSAIPYSPPITRLKARTNPKLRARLQSSLNLSCKDEISTSGEAIHFIKNDTVPACLEIHEDREKSAKGGGEVGPKMVLKHIPDGDATLLGPVMSPVTMVSPHIPLSSRSSSTCCDSSDDGAFPATNHHACKRNRKSIVLELKLSQEEVEMKGAPEGAVYQVDVLDTADFKPSSCPEKEVQVVDGACHCTLWVDQYSAINSLRRISIHHNGLLTQNEGRLLSKALSFLYLCVGSLRSSMIRNALLALKDIFTFVPQNALQAQVCTLAPLIAVSLQKCTGDKKFICTSVKEALLSGAQSGICLDILHIVLPMVQDRRVEVSAHATQIAGVALASLGVGSSRAVQELPSDLHKRDLFNAMNYASQGKSPEGRSAAVHALGRLRRFMGPKMFEKELREYVSDSDAKTVLSLLTGTKKMAERRSTKQSTSTCNRPSVREQVLAAKLVHMSMGNGAETASPQIGRKGDENPKDDN